MSCRVCQRTDEVGRPSREALESRASWGCDAELPVTDPDAPPRRGAPTVCWYLDCLRCGGSGKEPAPFVGPCGSCLGDRRGVSLRRCPNAPGQLPEMLSHLRLIAAEAAAGRFPSPSHAIDQPIGLFALRHAFLVAEEMAQDERRRRDESMRRETEAAARAHAAVAPGGQVLRGRRK